MLSESAHLAAKIQRDLHNWSSASGDGSSIRNSLLDGASTGVPATIQLDRSTSSVLNGLASNELSLRFLGLSQTQTMGVALDGALRDSLSSALTEVSKSLEIAAPQLKKVRSSSTVPQTVQATCDLLEALASAVHAVNNRLLHAALVDGESAPCNRSGPDSLARPKALHETARHTTAETRNTAKNSLVAEVDAQLTEEVRVLKSEVRRMKEREDVLLKKLRDLEIDCRVKAHTVASTTASAQAVFDENTILRQIAEHNQSLLREVDALHRCVAENETLKQEMSSKQKTIDCLMNKVDELKAELRKTKGQ